MQVKLSQSKKFLRKILHTNIFNTKSFQIRVSQSCHSFVCQKQAFSLEWHPESEHVRRKVDGWLYIHPISEIGMVNGWIIGLPRMLQEVASQMFLLVTRTAMSCSTAVIAASLDCHSQNELLRVLATLLSSNGDCTRTIAQRASSPTPLLYIYISITIWNHNRLLAGFC